MKLLKNKRGEVVIRAGFVADCRVSALVYLVLITTLRPPQCKHSESNIVDESWLVRRRLSLCSTEARKHLALLKGLNFWVSWVESYQCLLPTLLGMVKALLEWADELLSKMMDGVDWMGDWWIPLREDIPKKKLLFFWILFKWGGEGPCPIFWHIFGQ